MIKAEDVRKKINSAAQERVPFLFGVDYELAKGFFVENPLLQNDVFFRMDGVSNYEPQLFDECALRILSATSKDEYSRKFATVMDGLRRGDSFLANLTDSTQVECELTLEQIFRCTDSPFGLYHREGRFVSFSPERFVRIDAQRRISSHPMKGTIDASVPDARRVIMEDYKELCEHRTIVDLIRNDLSMVAQGVEVQRSRYIDTVYGAHGALLQVSSKVSGLLRPGLELGDVLFRMLPAGSISGAPKGATRQLIARAEGPHGRGFYTGVYGYFDGQVLDSAVAIRYLEQDEKGRTFYKSGGGITIHSDARSEYDEMLAKIYIPISRGR